MIFPLSPNSLGVSSPGLVWQLEAQRPRCLLSYSSAIPGPTGSRMDHPHTHILATQKVRWRKGGPALHFSGTARKWHHLFLYPIWPKLNHMNNRASKLFPATYWRFCYYRKKRELRLRDGQWFATIVNFQIAPLMMDELSEDTASFPACKAIDVPSSKYTPFLRPSMPV